MKKNRISRQWWGNVCILLIIMQTAPLLAAEGTARLSFQKTVRAGDNVQAYTIKKGDTVTHIIRRMGTTAPTYDVLKNLNPHIADLDKIYPGQKLILAQGKEQTTGGNASQKFRNYTTQKGDTLTRILRNELNAKPADMAGILRDLKQLNPEMANINKIFPGQILRLPLGGEAVAEQANAPGSAPSSAAAASPAPASLPVGNTLAVLRQIIGMLNGHLITTGQYFIPLPDSGEVTIDCTAIPIVELDDGTTILLDFTRRIPDELAGMIRSQWKNYHFVKIERGADIASILRNILLGSKSYSMTKTAKPFLIEDEPQISLLPDWLVTRQATADKPASQLGLFLTANREQLLPRPILSQAKKKGITICEVLVDQIQTRETEAPASIPPMARVAGAKGEELLQNLFAFLGLETMRNRDVKIFDTAKDGFDLSIKAAWLIKRGSKTILIHQNKLPQQFVDTLRNEDMEPLYLTPGLSKKSLLESVLPKLGISCQFALFSLPAGNTKSKFAVTFSALKIESDKGPWYLIDFDINQDIYELLSDYWKLNLLRY